jgi:hypothetical protein
MPQITWFILTEISFLAHTRLNEHSEQCTGWRHECGAADCEEIGMSNYVQTKIRSIADPDFQQMISELCHCVNLGRDQFENQPLSYLLMVIGKEKRALAKQYLPGNGILTGKVDKLSPDSVAHQVCRELANLNRTNIESFDGKMVLSLFKDCHLFFCPQPSRPKALTHRQKARRFETEMIERRRRNGDL